MDESTFDVGDFNDLLSGITSQAAPWVSAFTGTPVVPTPTSAQQAALQQAQINAQAQANLYKANPTLAGTLASPTVIIIVIGVLLLLFLGIIFVFRK